MLFVPEPSHARSIQEVTADDFVDWAEIDLPREIVYHCLKNSECHQFIHLDERPLQPNQEPPAPDRCNVFISEIVSHVLRTSSVTDYTDLQLLAAIRFNLHPRLEIEVMKWSTFRDLVLGDRQLAIEKLRKFDMVYGGADLMLDLRCVR
jgi:hypothetical protein